MQECLLPRVYVRRFAVQFAFLLILLVCPLRPVFAQTFNQIQFVIGTGGDDLRGDSSATATVQAGNGSTLQVITLKAQNQASWNNNTSHTVTATLTPPRTAASIGHIMITLTSHNGFLETDDNWNIESVVVKLSNNGAGAMTLLSGSGDPLARLTGSQPSVTLTPQPAAPPGFFSQIQFVIGTGGDDLRGDSSATATLQGPSGNTLQVLTLKAQNQAGWGNNSTHTVSFTLSPPQPLFGIANIIIRLTSHNGFGETDDNWNLQNITTTLSNNGAGPVQILNGSGNPLVRLTGSIPTILLPLPPVFLGPVCPQANACTNVTTYHNDSLRTGWNASETALTPANVNPTSFGHIATVPLDEQVDTQPLFVNGVAYLATENNTLYALNFWKGTSIIRNFGTPVPKPQGCGNNGPVVGIDGTPTIDLATRTIYVDTFTLEGGGATHKLHALDISSLAERAGSPITVTATQTLQGGGSFSFQAPFQRQRPGLLLSNNQVYAGYGSYCDFGGDNSRGWLLGWNKVSLAPLAAKQLNDRDPSGGGLFLSSIWMSGYGVAADGPGNLYFVTGNTTSGKYNSTFNISESTVKMSNDISHVLSFFTPSNVNSLDGGDTDYGSGGILLLPDQTGQFPHLATAAGKDGRMFVLNRDNMGGFASTNIPSNVPIGDCWCGQSYFESGTPTLGTPRVVSSGGNQVKLWSLTTTGVPVPSVASVATSEPVGSTAQDGGFFTSVSSNGRNSVVIWAVARPEGNDNHITLVALNGTPTGTSIPQLWSATAGFWPNTGGNANIVPTVVNGRVYVASNKQLQIFGLKTPPPPPGGRVEIEEAVPVAALPASTEAQYWGTVKSVDGNHFTLELRSGRVLQVDLTAAVSQNRAILVSAGEFVTVTGKTDASGVFQADSAVRAKGQALWGEDHEQ